MENCEDSLEFTIHSEDAFYDAVDAEAFYNEDSEIIYEHLKNRMVLKPFGDYLKRYIFRSAGFSGNYADVDLKEYQRYIIQSFAKTNTPKSFVESTAKLSALAKNWLTQTSVNRNIVFLLGFGLSMTAEDVSAFLIHALNERDFNFKDPSEVICWYCYKHDYGLSKYLQLMDMYQKLPYKNSRALADATIGLRDLFLRADDEEDLLRRLSEIKAENAGMMFSVTATSYFYRLYQKAKEIIARKYTEDAQAQADRKAKEYLSKMNHSLMLTIEEKNRKAEMIRRSAKVYTADEINEADVEKFLCCGVPYDGKGNLLKFSRSTLAKHFSSKRMSRQHIHEILAKRMGADRFDLITLSFFLFAMSDIEDNKVRYFRFVEETNRILEDCCFGRLYIANPYECFLQMCMLSDWPMGAYADVLERSFE